MPRRVFTPVGGFGHRRGRDRAICTIVMMHLAGTGDLQSSPLHSAR
jgi:hypothetical protein